MKVLTALSLLWTLFSLNALAISYSDADESKDEKLSRYISKLKNMQFEYDYEKNEADSAALRDSWIQPINLSYKYNRSTPYGNEQESSSAAISIDQPIFKSGGIYFGINYAKAQQRYKKLSIDKQKRAMIKDAVSILMQIKQTELKEIAQKYQIANSQINLEQTREKYMNGQLDSGFLNNAIIQKNIVTQTLFDIQTAKQRLITRFKSISDMDYKDADIPHLALLDERYFLEHSLDLKIARYKTESSRNLKNVEISKYLPTLSLNAGYTFQFDGNIIFNDGPNGSVTQPGTDYYSYGARVSMPLDFNTLRKIESTKVSYLKSVVEIDDSKRQLIALFEQVTQNLENFDKKIELSKENQRLYETLLAETTDLFKAGYKTQYDVDNLKNSIEIEKSKIKQFEIDKQLELLNLYEKISG